MLCVIFGRVLFFTLTGAGAPQVADLGEQRVVGSVSRSCSPHRRAQGAKTRGGRAHVIYVDSVVLQKSREYAL